VVKKVETRSLLAIEHKMNIADHAKEGKWDFADNTIEVISV
jgi:hypothetical protein